jgi:hypothetical protein
MYKKQKRIKKIFRLKNICWIIACVEIWDSGNFSTSPRMYKKQKLIKKSFGLGFREKTCFIDHLFLGENSWLKITYKNNFFTYTYKLLT